MDQLSLGGEPPIEARPAAADRLGDRLECERRATPLSDQLPSCLPDLPVQRSVAGAARAAIRFVLVLVHIFSPVDGRVRLRQTVTGFRYMLVPQLRGRAARWFSNGRFDHSRVKTGV